MRVESSRDSRETVYRILFFISLAHLLNDSIQSVIPAVFPILQSELALSYFQLGVILLVMNVTASCLQPLVGMMTDRRPMPFLPSVGLASSGLGMVGVALASDYGMVLLSVVLVGLGSAVFHPESSRVAHMAAGQRRGLAQSIFQVGGNFGQALAPLMTIVFFVRFGQTGALWFVLFSLAAVVVLFLVGLWYRKSVEDWQKKKSHRRAEGHQKGRLYALLLLIALVTVRSWMHSGIQGFFPLYLINVRGMNFSEAQVYLFIFLLAGAMGTFFGGPLADRFGHRSVLLFSMLGAVPFTATIPFLQGWAVYAVVFFSGFIVLCSFSVTVVYAQELMPGRIGLVSGLIFGLAFGMGGIGASLFGWVADWRGLSFVILVLAFLPLFGLLGFLLPKDRDVAEWNRDAAAGSAVGEVAAAK